MKSTILALLGILLAASSWSQEKIYLTANRQKTSADNAEYYRIAKQFKVKENPENGEKHYMIMEYYLSGRIEMVGSFLTERAVIKDGPFVFYHSNGREKERGIYRHDQRRGVWKFWGENGRLLEERNYLKDEGKGLVQEYLILNAFEKEGKQKKENTQSKGFKQENI